MHCPLLNSQLVWSLSQLLYVTLCLSQLKTNLKPVASYVKFIAEQSICFGHSESCKEASVEPSSWAESSTQNSASLEKL